MTETVFDNTHSANEQWRTIMRGKLRGAKISGSVTAEFADFILNLPSGNDTEIYNKMTPFFSIFLDNGFASEHYGTELNQL